MKKEPEREEIEYIVKLYFSKIIVIGFAILLIFVVGVLVGWSIG